MATSSSDDSDSDRLVIDWDSNQEPSDYEDTTTKNNSNLKQAINLENDPASKTLEHSSGKQKSSHCSSQSMPCRPSSFNRPWYRSQLMNLINKDNDSASNRTEQTNTNQKNYLCSSPSTPRRPSSKRSRYQPTGSFQPQFQDYDQMLSFNSSPNPKFEILDFKETLKTSTPKRRRHSAEFGESHAPCKLKHRSGGSN